MNQELREAYAYHRRNRFSIGATRALDLARADVAAGKRRYTSTIHPKHAGWNRPQGESYVESLAEAGLRFVGYADELSRYIGHKGWFIDTFQDETYRGCAVQLPGRNGVARFLAAYEESTNGGYVVDFSTVYTENTRDGYGSARDCDAALDAARAGDGMAESNAERKREYQTAWQAGARWNDAGEEVKALRREALEILKERRTVENVNAPTLCSVIRSRVESILESIAELRAEREKLADGDADELIFWPGEQRLRDAFNEGAGATVLA